MNMQCGQKQSACYEMIASRDNPGFPPKEKSLKPSYLKMLTLPYGLCFKQPSSRPFYGLLPCIVQILAWTSSHQQGLTDHPIWTKWVIVFISPFVSCLLLHLYHIASHKISTKYIKKKKLHAWRHFGLCPHIGMQLIIHKQYVTIIL